MALASWFSGTVIVGTRFETALNAKFHRQTATLLLALLWTADAAFISGDLWLRAMDAPAGHQLWLGTDQGIPEFYQYLKWLWACVLILVLGWQARAPEISVWLPVIAFLLVDDAFQLHERAGWQTRDRLADLHISISGDLGEALVLITVGLFALGVVTLGYSRSRPDARAVHVDLVALLTLTASFGILFDLLHGLASGPIKTVAGILEESGEMIAVSMLVAYLFYVNAQRRVPTIHTRWDKIRDRVAGYGPLRKHVYPVDSGVQPPEH